MKTRKMQLQLKDNDGNLVRKKTQNITGRG